MKKILRGLFGLIAAVLAYVPFLGLAYWVGSGGTAMSYIAAGLFAFFGLVFSIAVFGWLGIEDKEDSVKVKPQAGRKTKASKEDDRLDPVSAGLAVAVGMDHSDDFDDDGFDI